MIQDKMGIIEPSTAIKARSGQMKRLIGLISGVVLLAVPFVVFAQETAQASGEFSVKNVFAGLAGLGGALILGKVKKSVVPFKWGTSQAAGASNNIIPVTNPVMIGLGAWEATKSVESTAWAVGGSFAAWGLHQLGKKLFG